MGGFFFFFCVFRSEKVHPIFLFVANILITFSQPQITSVPTVSNHNLAQLSFKPNFFGLNKYWEGEGEGEERTIKYGENVGKGITFR